MLVMLPSEFHGIFTAMQMTEVVVVNIESNVLCLETKKCKKQM